MQAGQPLQVNLAGKAVKDEGFSQRLKVQFIWGGVERKGSKTNRNDKDQLLAKSGKSKMQAANKTHTVPVLDNLVVPGSWFIMLPVQQGDWVHLSLEQQLFNNRSGFLLHCAVADVAVLWEPQHLLFDPKKLRID